MRFIWISLIIYIAIFRSCSNNNLTIYKTDKSPSIDGVLDSLWNKAARINMEHIYRNSYYWENKSDLYGEGWFSYDNSNLYLFFNILDDIKYSHSIPETIYDLAWGKGQSDGVTLHFDTNLDNQDDLVYEFCYGFSNEITDCNLQHTRIQLESVDTNHGYTLEIKIPLSYLHLSRANQFNMFIELNDNDKRVDQNGVIGDRETQIVWPTNIYKSKNVYSLLLLQ